MTSAFELTDNLQLTVIVPVYNIDNSYLKMCLDSILSQTFKDFELVIVDDGSTKENAEILDEYASKDKRISVLHQENAGAAAARNTGLSIAKGKYVTFVDADDTISPDTFLKITSKAIESDLDVLMWGMYLSFDDKMKEFSPYSENIELFTPVQKEELQYKCLVGALPFYKMPPATQDAAGSACAKLYRLQFLKDNNLYYTKGLKRAEDMTFNLKVFDAAERIGYLYDFLYYYRQLATSATYMYRENGIEVFTASLEEMQRFIIEKNKSDLYRQIFYMRCMFFFLESMDMDYFNKNNPKSLSMRLKEMRHMAAKEPYREAFSNLRTEHLTFARKIPLFLIKHNMMLTLACFYGVFRLIKGK